MNTLLLVVFVQLPVMIALSIGVQLIYAKWRARKRCKISSIHSAHENLINALEAVEDMDAVLVVWTERGCNNKFHLHSNANVEQFVDALAGLRVNGMLRSK